MTTSTVSVSNTNIVRQLSSDLPNVDVSKVALMIDEMGIEITARQLGFDLSHYDNQVLSGRLLIHDNKTKSLSLSEYVTAMEEIFNPECVEFYRANIEALQQAVDSNDALDLNHDWFSANVLKTTYLA